MNEYILYCTIFKSSSKIQTLYQIELVNANGQYNNCANHLNKYKLTKCIGRLDEHTETLEK